MIQQIRLVYWNTIQYTFKAAGEDFFGNSCELNVDTASVDTVKVLANSSLFNHPARTE